MDLQYRFVITSELKPIGCLDLIDFDLVNSRVELGIFIDEKYRKNGLDFNALQEIKNKICSGPGKINLRQRRGGDSLGEVSPREYEYVIPYYTVLYK